MSVLLWLTNQIKSLSVYYESPYMIDQDCCYYHHNNNHHHSNRPCHYQQQTNIYNSNNYNQIVTSKTIDTTSTPPEKSFSNGDDNDDCSAWRSDSEGFILISKGTDYMNPIGTEGEVELEVVEESENIIEK